MIITCRMKQIRNLGNFNSDQYEIEVQDNVRHGETEEGAYDRLYGFLDTKMNTYLLKLGNSVDVGLFRSELKKLLQYFTTDPLKKEHVCKVLKENNYDLMNFNDYQIADIVKMKNIVRKLIIDMETKEEFEDEDIE